MSLFGMAGSAFSSFCSTPPPSLFPSSSVLSLSRITTTAPLRGEFGPMASWTSNTGYEPNVGVNHQTDSTTIFDEADDYQEKASLSVSEQVPHEKSRSSSRKSAAGPVPTVFGSSVGHSFGKPQRDCVPETSLLSQLTRPRKLESRSVSTIDESLMTGKRDRGESIGQFMRDRENLHKILERKAESAIQGENEAQKNYQRLKLMWKSEGGSKAVQKSPCMRLIEKLKLKDYSFIRRICGVTMLKEKDLVCVENWKRWISSSKKVAQKLRRRCSEESDRARQAK